MDFPKKTIVIVGATGNQGSSVAHSFLGLSNWHVRCLSRNPTSSASQELAALGAEVVRADLSDVSSLSRAFANANAIFVNTDFWGPFVASKKVASAQGNMQPTSDEIAFEIEVLHGKNAARAAAAVPTLERFVYSTLAGVKKNSEGQFSCLHSDSKQTVSDYILEEVPELARRSSFIYLGAYNTNALISPRLDPASGRYKFLLPFEINVKMPIIDPKNSTGPFVRALIEDENAGTNLLAYDSYWSFQELVDKWSQASGKEADFMGVTTEFMHQKLGIPNEVLAAVDTMKEYGYMGKIDFIEPFQLKKQVQTKSFETWLNERDWKAELSMNNSKPQLRSME